MTIFIAQKKHSYMQHKQLSISEHGLYRKTLTL